MVGESQVKVFNCSACGAPITLRGLGQTSTVACGACASIIDISDENYRILYQYFNLVQEGFIPIGTRGTIRDTQVQVIGYMLRCDASGEYQWEEYLLFNPYKGFSWLMNYQGHWTLIVTLPDMTAPISESSVQYDGRSYKLFLTGKARVKYVLGEFYWQVKLGDQVSVADYISPPFILSREATSDETVWSLGEYLAPAEIAEAFQIKGPLPQRVGVGAAQPSPCQHYAQEIKLIGAFFALLLILVQLIFSGAAQSKIVLERTYQYTPLHGAPARTEVSDVFELPARSSNLEFAVSAPVINGWLSLDADLINSEGQELQGAELEVAYYSGHDSDGNWSEGAQYSRAVLSEVPAGLYRLSFQTTADPQLAALPYRLVITRDVPNWGYFALTFLLILVVPIALWIREASFESRRWQESDP